MRSMRILVGLMFVVLLSLAPPALAATDHEIFPFEYTTFNECTGEDVHLAGAFHVVEREVEGHLVFHFNEINLTGVGLTTGIVYRTSGSPLNFTLSAESGTGVEMTEVNNLGLISQGGTDDLQVRFTSHVTVTPSGDVTVEFADFIVHCRG
jgi:hypothetical protein